MDGELKLLEKDVREMKAKLAEIHGAIVGNPLTQDGGIALRLHEAESKIQTLEDRIEMAEKKQIKYNVYTVIMWVCAGGVAMAIYYAFINNIKFK